MPKRRVLILVGGRSEEHEVSLISGKHILAALDRTKFEPLIVVIEKNGVMTRTSEELMAALPNNPKLVKTPQGAPVILRPYSLSNKRRAIIVGEEEFEFDVVFPVIHGKGGEDGSIQGMFEVFQIPVVGCPVEASALCMDKGLTKKLCESAGIPVAPYVEIFKWQKEKYLPKKYPVFIKPAHTGSSVGVVKVKSLEELSAAYEQAFQHDEKILVEDAVVGREIEVAVLGNPPDLIASPAGEIRPKLEFYSYEAKYVLEDGADLLFPAPISADELKTVQSLAKKAFQALQCRGMARVDFFLTAKGEFFFNEINTIPGFTPISMYPKLMQLAGVSYSDLITRLIELASGTQG